MELTELVLRMKKKDGDLNITVKWSDNDGQFKYWICKWDYDVRRYNCLLMFTTYHDLKQYILENY